MFFGVLLLGAELVSKLDKKLRTLSEDLVHFRTLETKVRTVQKTANELSGSLTDLQKFAAGTGDCSLELIQKFLSASYEYPQVKIQERTEKGVQTEAFVPSVEKDNAVVQFRFLNLITTLQSFYKKFWSVPLSLGGTVLQIGVMKIMCVDQRVPKLQISFRTLSSIGAKDDFSLMVSVLNHHNGCSFFERKISGNKACNIHHVVWAAIEKKESNWLDSGGNMTVYCAKV